MNPKNAAMLIRNAEEKRKQLYVPVFGLQIKSATKFFFKYKYNTLTSTYL